MSSMKGRRSAADWLNLAATPTFAVMALVTHRAGVNGQSMMSSMSPSASPIDGMVPMYVMMSVFHAAAWIRLVARGLERVHERLTSTRLLGTAPRQPELDG